ncbi:MAG: MmcB family DNA repair protein [Kiloniellales bacterium]|nr:MmcB family DNA repair protein [Kiloniellales bacterium]
MSVQQPPFRSAPGVSPARGDDGRERITSELTRGVARLLTEMKYAPLTEFTLRSGRRVDLIGLGPKGEIIVVEIKSSLEDFRSDKKWQEYLDFCDLFYFAVPDFFPFEILPDDTGLMIADPFSAVIARDSSRLKLNASRRRSLHLNFARTAARRLSGIIEA